MELLNTLEGLLRSLGFDLDIHQFLALFGLGLARHLVLINLIPVFGGQAVPAKARVGLGVILTAIAFPAMSAPPEGELNTVLFVGLLAKEVVIGLILGVFVYFIFFAVQMAGKLIDIQRGMNQAVLFSLQLKGNISFVGQLKFQAALVLFFTFDGHHHLIRAISNSFLLIPVSSFPELAASVPALSEQVIRASADLFVIALQLAAPIIVVLFLVDVIMGVLNRVAPQVNVFYESMPAKSLIGLAMLFLVIGFLLGQFEGYFAESLSQFIRASETI